MHGPGRLVLYLWALLPTQPSGEQRCAAAALGLASLVFWGGGRGAVGCLVLVLGRRDMHLRPAYSWMMCFGSSQWRDHVLPSSRYSEQAPVMLLTGCVLVSLPCILMKDITLFSPSLLGQDTLCLLCLFLSGLLVDPALPRSGPFLLNGSGGCVGALSCFQFGIWLGCVVLRLMGGSGERREWREEAESKHDLFPLRICQKHPLSWTKEK